VTAAALRMELRRSRTIAIWLAVVLIAYAGSMSVFYPIIAENTALLDEYLELWPEGFLAAFGMTGSLADPGVFFTTYVGSMIWPIIAAIAAILVGTRGPAADAERGFLDLALATPLPRVRYLAMSIAGQALLMAALATVMIVAVLAVGAIVDAGFDAGRFLLVIPSAFAFGCAIAAVATLLAVVSLSRGIAGGVTVAILLGMYLANVIAQIEPDLGWLRSLSAFAYFDTTAIIDEGQLMATDLAVFAVVAVSAWGAALVAFRRRDLAA
jgi:ABC-2 type transport system permease protein